MFITFEGLDFSGKSTQAQLLVEKLAKLPIARGEALQKAHLIREPGGTHISERIREILLDKKHLEMSDAAELFLFSASRAQLVTEIILPALTRGDIVVCDRFDDSTTVYQGYGRGLDLDAIRNINKLATDGIAPDLTFLVDIPIEEIRRRKGLAGLSFDRMEVSGHDFYARVRNGYLALAAAEPDRWYRVDGMASVEEVARRIWSVVEQKLTIHKSSA
ncbi:MAG: dTMP kinase [Ignavibacteriae bacterium]|nr:dTMP kinase [Ignavibacteriota bacterium]